MAYTSDLKVYGYTKVLEKIVTNVKRLETVGFQLQIGSELKQIFATLATVNGDNLGRHTILGLFESFNSTFFCEKCWAMKSDVQKKFHERDFVLRDSESFDRQVQV